MMRPAAERAQDRAAMAKPLSGSPEPAKGGEPARHSTSPAAMAYVPAPRRSCGREAEGGGLLNRYTVEKPYRGFESLRLRQCPVRSQDVCKNTAMPET